MHKLRLGDAFHITMGGQTITDAVDQIKTVLPFGTEALRSVPGKGCCPLVTCTPYGVNSHRLLVRAAVGA